MISCQWMYSSSIMRILVLILLGFSGVAHTADSQCFGTVGKGRIDGSVKLPLNGPNFSAYSSLAAAMQRTHVHTKVAQVVTRSFAALHRRFPSTVYVYGETGWPSGGPFRPHRTHQNGLSVDFFVPVTQTNGHSVPLPTHIGNRWGYNIEFDAQAQYQTYRIDFVALTEHLYELHHAAKAEGIGIALVIFDTTYLPKLFATPRGAYVRQHIPFMRGKPWVRHDDHYHVDFAVPCRPMMRY